MEMYRRAESQTFDSTLTLLGAAAALSGFWIALMISIVLGAPNSLSIAAIGLAAVGLGLHFIWLASAQPHLGLLAVVFLMIGLIRPDVVDVRLPVGGAKLHDLALLGMFGLLAFRRLLRRDLAIPWWPVGGPLLAFLGWAFFSAIYGVTYRDVLPSETLNESRALITYLIFFVAAWSIERRSQLLVVLTGLFVFANIGASVVILQQSLGADNRLLQVMSSAGWGVWQEGDAGGFGTIRVVPPAHLLMYTMHVVAFALAMWRGLSLRYRALMALQFAYFSIGLIFTYTRGQWISSLIAIFIVSILLPLSEKIKLIKIVFIAIIVVLLTYSATATQVHTWMENSPAAETLSARLLSIFTPQDTLETSSLEWRLFETEEAIRSITENPLLGVGVGNYYRDVTVLQFEARNGRLGLTRYMHNGYLYIAVKMGLVGLAIFGWLAFVVVFFGRRLYSGTNGFEQRLTLALLAGFIGLFFWSMTSPLFLESESSVTIGLMIGLLASVRHLRQNEA